MEKIIGNIAISVINNYLKTVVKNNEKCQNCQIGFKLDEEHICFCAGECVANNFKYFKER